MNIRFINQPEGAVQSRAPIAIESFLSYPEHKLEINITAEEAVSAIGQLVKAVDAYNRKYPNAQVRNPLPDALRVLTLDARIKAFLSDFDPQALKQAEKALQA